MRFERDERMFRLGNQAGFLAGYFIFTTLLFYIMSFTHRFEYIHMMGITALVAIAGTAIKRL